MTKTVVECNPRQFTEGINQLTMVALNVPDHGASSRSTSSKTHDFHGLWELAALYWLPFPQHRFRSLNMRLVTCSSSVCEEALLQESEPTAKYKLLYMMASG